MTNTYWEYDGMITFTMRECFLRPPFCSILSGSRWTSMDTDSVWYYSHPTLPGWFYFCGSLHGSGHEAEAYPGFKFSILGVPLEQSKLHSRSFNWPDIPGYSNQREVLLLRIRLPQVLLAQLKQELSHCILQKTITKRELQSLTGLLQFATKVIWPGRPFIRQLYMIQSIGSHPDHHICLNSTARADIIIMVVLICREMELYFFTLG